MILFTDVKQVKYSINQLTKILTFLIILISLVSVNTYATTIESKLKMDEFNQIYKDDLKNEMNFFSFVIITMVEGAYYYTFPISIGLLLEYTNLTSTFPKLSNFLFLLFEISSEIGLSNPIVFPHTLTHVTGRGQIHTFGLLGEGTGGSSGYGTVDFWLIGFTGLRGYTNDGFIKMIGWALWCKY